MDLHAGSVIEQLLLPDREKALAKQRLGQVLANLKAIGVIDETGQQRAGGFIATLRGVDALFVHYCLTHRDFDYAHTVELVEYLLEEEAISKILRRKTDEKRREWILVRLRERRREEPQTTWEDVEEEYEREFPRELTEVEKVHAEFLAELPHPELHGGKVAKRIWAEMESKDQSFFDFVEEHSLAHQEGILFSYLARVMRTAKMLGEATTLPDFHLLEQAIRRALAAIDERVLEGA